ncbi:hypothetical protein ABZ725_29640 [Streptomyces sp. NPDC006872]|uniref:hypothetical protein n=1 Tax=Streptomyces sp. NPDC006872 TaxID=3155720 RepID=UPI0034020A6D
MQARSAATVRPGPTSRAGADSRRSSPATTRTSLPSGTSERRTSVSVLPGLAVTFRQSW